MISYVPTAQLSSLCGSMSQPVSIRNSFRIAKHVAAPSRYGPRSLRERSWISVRNAWTDQNMTGGINMKSRESHRAKKSSSSLLWLSILAAMILPAAGFSGETVTLKNGKTLKGSIAAWSEDRTRIYFQPAAPVQEPQWISLSEIERLQLSSKVVNSRPSTKPTIIPKDNPSATGAQKQKK